MSKVITKEKLAESIRCMGQWLIVHSDEIASIDLRQDLKITIRYDLTYGDMPSIEIKQGYVSKDATEALWR